MGREKKDTALVSDECYISRKHSARENKISAFLHVNRPFVRFKLRALSNRPTCILIISFAESYIQYQIFKYLIWLLCVSCLCLKFPASFLLTFCKRIFQWHRVKRASLALCLRPPAFGESATCFNRAKTNVCDIAQHKVCCFHSHTERKTPKEQPKALTVPSVTTSCQCSFLSSTYSKGNLFLKLKV